MGNEGALMVLYEPVNSRQRTDKVFREIQMTGFSDDDEQPNPALEDRRQFVRLVPNTAVVGDGIPTLATHEGQPLNVGAGLVEMVRMTFDRDPMLPQDLRKLPPQVAVREKGRLHAARS